MDDTPTIDPMRLLLAVALLLTALASAWAQSPLAAQVRAWSTRYHEDPARIDTMRADLTAAVGADPHVDTLIALAQVCFIWGDIRATTSDDKLAAYEQGREAAKRAVEIAPRNVLAHFWYATNIGRWGQTKGVVRSLFLLPTVRKEIATVFEIDPKFPPAYSLAGNVYYEVPEMLGGDLVRAEQMFRSGLLLDPRFTGMRVGLAKTLIKKGRLAEARKELEAVLAETAPSNLADWTLKDSTRARELLASIRDKP
jgi:tetratricopeptide (TPR) repeat protein